MKPFVIINPAARGGMAHSLWPGVKELLRQEIGSFEFMLTQDKGHATELSLSALRAGFDWIISLGGDGTFQEVTTAYNPQEHDAHFSFLMLGTGSDFGRSFRLPIDLRARILRLAKAPVREVDLGRASFTGFDGQRQELGFNNVASFGLSGEVDRRINQAKFAKVLGGQMLFWLASFTSMLTYPNPRLHLKWDEGELELNAKLVALGNGEFFGGSMWVAPQAKLDDGLLDVVIFQDVTPLDMLLSTPRLYGGRILSHPKVKHFRCKHLEAEVLDGGAVLLDLDGEAPGRLSAKFWLQPKALRLRI